MRLDSRRAEGRPRPNELHTAEKTCPETPLGHPQGYRIRKLSTAWPRTTSPSLRLGLFSIPWWVLLAPGGEFGGFFRPSSEAGSRKPRFTQLVSLEPHCARPLWSSMHSRQAKCGSSDTSWVKRGFLDPASPNSCRW